MQRSSDLISDSYRALNADLHRRDPSYGTTGRRHVAIIRELACRYRARHILDYGCGKQDLWKALHSELEVRSFDPAIPGLDAQPEPADFVVCIDVLEHVEPEYLDTVCDDLVRVTLIVGYFTIATRPSLKRLADGTNSHKIVKEPMWWVESFAKLFHIDKHWTPEGGNGVHLIIKSKQA